MTKSRSRCAIYTRKSTEEGLDQDFNSLDAQREACEAFVTSQAGLGWRSTSKRYDDGGVSGGHMERPGLQRLLGDIEAGKVDVVVVYKIDRLTRSLMDFAKMVSVFDRHDVSFVAVTQQFNTTTSMGRLTLNVLLSFAQFEREVTAERIRDKIAASKRKGMWMGGVPPLGYDVEDKQLVVNVAEARVVKQLFDLYLEVGSVRGLKITADNLSLRTKLYTYKDGRTVGGKPFSRGHLYALLSNPVYVGEIRHRGERFPGQHDAIIHQAHWNAVSKRLTSNTVGRHQAKNATERSLLSGLVFDDTGDRLSLSHATKKGRRYRYYISHRLMQTHSDGQDGWRLPAHELERSVLQAVTEHLTNTELNVGQRANNDCELHTLHRARQNSEDLRQQLSSNHPTEQRAALRRIVERIDICRGHMRIRLLEQPGLTGLSSATDEGDTDRNNSEAKTLDVPFTLRRRGVETKIVLNKSMTDQVNPDSKLIGAVANAHNWFRKLTSGDAASIQELAASEGLPRCNVSRTLPLAFLAPDIVEAIVAGRQPTDLTWEKLKRATPLPSCWRQQRRLLGFEEPK